MPQTARTDVARVGRWREPFASVEVFGTSGTKPVAFPHSEFLFSLTSAFGTRGFNILPLTKRRADFTALVAAFARLIASDGGHKTDIFSDVMKSRHKQR